MRCDEAEEFISALYDGETVPLEAAEHAAHCAHCRELLKSYAETGAALRSYGSLLLAQPVPPRTWLTTRRNKTKWWEKGFQMMRIPRIAFACLLLLLAGLGSRLALVEVRAHEDGSVLMLKLTPAVGDSIHCDVSIADTKHNSCGGLDQIDRSNLFYAVKTLKKDGDRVLLSIRSKVTPLGPAGFGPDTAATLPETQSWFTPGEILALPNTGELKIALTGEWADHLPVGGHQLLDPGPNEIRLTSPLLLKNKAVVADMSPLSAASDKPGDGASFYVPGEGRFILSTTPLAGAVVATVELGRVTFESDGQQYILVNGMPVCRAEKLWVLHQAAYQPSPETAPGPEMGAGPIDKLL